MIFTRSALLEPNADVHLHAAAAEDVEGFRAQLIGNENFGHEHPYAAIWRAARQLANAQSSHGVRDCRSLCSIVAPHQMRKSRRRGSIRCRIERHAFLLEDRGQILGKLRLAGLRERCHALIDHLQANTRVAANRRHRTRESRPRPSARPIPSSTPALAFARACNASRPPMRSRPFQRVDIVLGGEQRRRVDGRAFEQLLIEFAFFGHAKNLRQRPCGYMAFQTGHRAGGRINIP